MEVLNRNFEDFLKLLNANSVKYLVIGGYAVALHGFVRATGDLDVFVELSNENAEKLVAALRAFGFEDPAAFRDVLLDKGKMIRIGVPPLRLEILNEISGVEFADCHERRVMEKIGDVLIPFIDVEDLIKNKKASGRPKDLADVAELSRKLPN